MYVSTAIERFPPHFLARPYEGNVPIDAASLIPAKDVVVKVGSVYRRAPSPRLRGEG